MSSNGPPGEGNQTGPAAAGGGGRRALARAAAVFLLIGVVCFGWWWIFSRPYVSTDDAYAAGNQVRLGPRTSGVVLEIYCDNTQRVEAGEILLRLDDTDARLALSRAADELAQAARQTHSQTAQKNRLEALVRARASDLEAVRAEYHRRVDLKNNSAVTAEELERHLQQFQVAGANLAAAEHDLAAQERLLGPGEPRGRPQVSLAATRVKEAWIALKRCEIKSPVSGVVARRTVQVGSYVTPASSLLVVVPDEVWAEANFKESQLARVKPGHRAVVTADLYGGEAEYEGTVLGLAAGTGSVFSLLPPENATGNWIKVVQRVPVRLAVSGPDLDDHPLLLGLSLRVRIKVDEPPSGAAPETAGRGAPVYAAAPEDLDLPGLELLVETVLTANGLPPSAAFDAAADGDAAPSGPAGLTGEAASGGAAR